jgi:hypothetical protein
MSYPLCKDSAGQNRGGFTRYKNNTTNCKIIQGKAKRREWRVEGGDWRRSVEYLE